jgi:hypothetical protein
MVAWTLFQSLTSAIWARHLMGHAANSAISNYWGEMLSARDVWEILVNGGLKDQPVGPWVMLAISAASLLVLWSGWHLQARSAEVPPTLSAWIWGGVDALIVGLPILISGQLLAWMLFKVGSTGIPFLGWMNLVGGTLVQLSVLSTLMLQWWLCRVDRASFQERGWRLGSWSALGRHLGHTFLMLWTYAQQWTILVLAGVIVRVGIFLVVLRMAWRWGGGSTFHVWIFLLLLMAATLANAWLIGWFLRVVALFWRQDKRVKSEIQSLIASTGDFQ